MIDVEPSCVLSPQLQEIVFRFYPISLKDLKTKAELLHRRDNKYVLSTDKIFLFLQAAQIDFDILEINNFRQFSYYSQYFDSQEFHTHQDHNKGRRKRIKVRYRSYINSDLHFFEVKMKGFRKLTQKYRLSIKPHELLLNGKLHPKLQNFCHNTLKKNDYNIWKHCFIPSINVYYKRITLVAKGGSERITIDNRVAFSDIDQSQLLYLNNERWIVEIKSSTGRTAMDRWMLRSGQRPLAKCSKYGMGINLIKRKGVNNRFSPVLRRFFNY